MPLAEFSIPASAVLKHLQALGVNHLVTVPDWVQMSLHQQIANGGTGIELLNVCSENQCVTVGAGLTLGGRKPILLMQNQGLYNCVNTLRAVCLDAHVPLVFLVGQFGREYANLGQDPKQSRRTMVRVMEPMLDSLGVPWLRLERASDLGCLARAYEMAETRANACVVLVGAPMAWS